LFIINSSFILTENKSNDFSISIPSAFSPSFSSGDITETEINSLFSAFCLDEKGLSKKAFEYAYKGYRKLIKRKNIDNPRYLTICDFSQSSNKKRFYLLDMENHTVVRNTYVAHGKNSGGVYANRFSNKPSSLQSSLGFYVTTHTYSGEHGLSLRVKGLEAGINDKAYHRAIVIHGADYIEESWLSNSGRMGRSFGCPAVPKSESKEIINTIKDGTIMFIYHPTKNYLLKTRIVND
jgi:hypothetical protein